MCLKRSRNNTWPTCTHSGRTGIHTLTHWDSLHWNSNGNKWWVRYSSYHDDVFLWTERPTDRQSELKRHNQNHNIPTSCLFCDKFFRLLHYDEQGNKLGDFQAYPYVDPGAFNWSPEPKLTSSFFFRHALCGFSAFLHQKIPPWGWFRLDALCADTSVVQTSVESPGGSGGVGLQGAGYDVGYDKTYPLGSS